MKNLTKVLCLAAAILISANRSTADDVKLPLIGEWTNNTNNAAISDVKFFPNGLLTVVSKGNGWSARYKVTSSSALRSDIYLVKGHIKMGDLVHFADRDKPSPTSQSKQSIDEDGKMDFSAKLTNHEKVMTLQVDNKGVKKEFILFKTNDIKTGNIPIN